MGSLIVMLGQNEMNGDLQQMKPVVKTVRRMIVHRDYNPETFDNDIALLELDTPFELKPHVVPICLPDQDYHLVGEYAHIAGFGKLNYGKQSKAQVTGRDSTRNELGSMNSFVNAIDQEWLTPVHEPF